MVSLHLLTFDYVNVQVLQYVLSNYYLLLNLIYTSTTVPLYAHPTAHNLLHRPFGLNANSILLIASIAISTSGMMGIIYFSYYY